jgi:cytochrome bd-type quinol oxidase subunit 2
MFLYTIFTAIVAVVAGILIAKREKKAEDVVYGKLDIAGRVTNIVLIPVYIVLGVFCLVLGVFSHPGYGGFLGILGWIVAVIIASQPLFSGIGLGLSVALRKKGRSKQSFAVQFAGLAGAALSLILFVVFYDNLLGSIN